MKSDISSFGLGSNPLEDFSLYVHRYEASSASLAPIVMIFRPIPIMRYALEPSYQLLGPGKTFQKSHLYTMLSVLLAMWRTGYTQ